MGFIVNADIETNRGPTSELYIRIENWKINKAVGEIKFTTTTWVSKEFADRFLREYFDEPLKNSVGIVSSKLVYYSDDNLDGKEYDVPNYFTMPMYVEKEVEVPIYETKKVSKEFPYVSFDENGDEITLYRTVTSEEEVQVGTEKVTKQVMDYGIVDRLAEVTYNYLKQQLKEYFPEELIEKY